MARIAFGGFQHETNTFAPQKTDLQDFQIGGAYPPLTRSEALFDAVAGMNIPVAGFIEDARAAGHQLVPLSWSMAVPAAAVTDEAYETVGGWLMEDLAGAGTLDAVYLDLHGAMVAERFEDGEGELLRRVRDIVGPDMPVVVSLDLHANVTPAMIEHASALIAFRTYPHVDRADTGRRCAAHLHGLVSGNGAPFKAYRQIPYIIPLPWQCTLVEPAVSIYKTLEELENGEARSLSFTPGFPLADIHDCGPAVFGYGRTQGAADRVVAALAEEVAGTESDFAGTLHTPDDAVARAMKRASGASGPMILADTQDNPGAGGTEDTIGILESLVRQSAQGTLVVFIYDADVAAQAHAAGEGVEIEAALGAKSGFPGEAPQRGT
ncbi:MAG: M81 family metallopeptidase, partial [Rhodospirillales bacterium]|nr:M81 family metallopeptidase [Rhodospirillales bacterium]